MRNLSVNELHIGDKVYFNEIKGITNTYIVLVNINENEKGKYGNIAYVSDFIDDFTKEKIKKIDNNAFFFYREENKKDTEIDEIIDNYIVTTQENSNTQKEEVINMSKKESKPMNTLTKVVLVLAGVGCVGAIAFGIATMQTVKENEIKEASAMVQIEAQDSTEKTEVEQIVEESMEDTYRKEAEALWQQHSEELICSNEQFVDKYMQYRSSGLTSEQAWNSLYNEFAKENQVQFNESGEAIAEPSDMDVLITQEPDEDMDEPVVEEPEVIEETVDFVVEDITPCQLYAISAVNVRQGPDANDFDKISSLKLNQRVTVTGIVKQYKDEACLWYRIEGSQGNIGYVSGAYLAENPVGVASNSGSQSDNNNNQTVDTETQNHSTENTNQTPSNQNTGTGTNIGGFTFSQGGAGMAGSEFGGQADADHGYTGDVTLE